MTVRLRTPPPLDNELLVDAADDGTVEVGNGRILVAQGFPAEPLDTADLPTPVGFATAQAAGSAYEGLRQHPFPTCFSCGVERDPDDALCLRTGLLPGHETLRAATWVPREVTAEITWAALDCPGGWASGIAGREMVLGTMTAQVRQLPGKGEEHVVMAWPVGHEGRRFHSGTALYDGHGHLLAQARATWITVQAADFRPREL